ncbi:MAG TPA: caspase family protein [Campylobacterales bacterium]|nr:caspase family protein [Campylobacterales bacterium]
MRISTKMQTEQRVALVIGNNNYQGDRLPKLINPINDAMAIKNILEHKGFDVIYQEDGGIREMRKVLSTFYKKIAKGGVGFFYFSGHGIEVEGQNYIIPIDAKIEEKSDTEYEAIALGKITKRMQNAKNRLNIVVLDACRNDPFSRSAGTGGLAKTEPIGLFVSFSTGAGSVASDGKSGENGLFTKSLIKHMQQELDLQDVFQKTREEVYDNSNQKQFPAIYNQTIRGKFFFTLPTSSPKEAESSQKSVQQSEVPKKVDYNTQSQAKSISKSSSNLTFKEQMDDDFDSFMKDME